jgi:hypothetical protein
MGTLSFLLLALVIVCFHELAGICVGPGRVPDRLHAPQITDMCMLLLLLLCL